MHVLVPFLSISSKEILGLISELIVGLSEVLGKGREIVSGIVVLPSSGYGSDVGNSEATGRPTL